MMYEQVDNASQTARLEDYLEAIKSHRLLVAITTIVVALAIWWVADSRVPNFESEAAVSLGPSPIGAVNSNLRAPSEERESEIVASRDVATEVSRRVADAPEPATLLEDLEVEFVPNSEVLIVTYSGTDADTVSMVANTVAEVYVERREAEALDFYEADVATVQAQLDSARAAVDAAQERTDELGAQRRIALTEQDPEIRTARVADLDAELSVVRSERQLAINAANTASNNLNSAVRRLETRQSSADVIRLSEPSTSATGLPTSMFALAGVLLGFLAGTALAFLIERLDTTASDTRALQLALGASVVGEIPAFGGLGQRRQDLIMLSERGGVVAHSTKEAFRRLRSAVQFLAPTAGENDSLVIAISSAHPGEGKSTVSSNLAIAIAQGGTRVVLVSADMRRPTLERMFGVATQPGLSDALAHNVETLEVVNTPVENLFIVPSGTTPSNPSELLGSPSFAATVEQLREAAPIVIVDTPPVLATSDALSLSPHTDGFLIVVDSRATDTDDLLQVAAELDRSGSRLLGGVLNRDRRKRGTFRKRSRYSYAQ